MRNRQNLLRNKSLTFWGHLIPDGYTAKRAQKKICLISSAMTRGLKMQINQAGLLAMASTYPNRLPIYSVASGRILNPHSNGIAQDSHLFPFSNHSGRILRRSDYLIYFDCQSSQTSISIYEKKKLVN